MSSGEKPTSVLVRYARCHVIGHGVRKEQLYTGIRGSDDSLSGRANVCRVNFHILSDCNSKFRMKESIALQDREGNLFFPSNLYIGLGIRLDLMT